MALEPGTRLGAYEILNLLGIGGMGEVYRARDTKLGRLVALKTLPEGFVHDSDRVSRFHREAQVLASLNHPNIAQIYGLEEANGAQFLVLELVDGESLDERIRRGPLPLDDALGIAKQVAEALEAAHRKGIIHRDLKPANVVLTKGGRVKLLDFGLAKATGGVMDETHAVAVTTARTQNGALVGTVAYMSPEQTRGHVVTTSADVWAFGCVLYELLTGTRAFRGDTFSDTVVSILEREPDWHALPVATPAWVRGLLRRCLVKDATRRLQDIGEAVHEARSDGRGRAHDLSARPEVRFCRTSDGVSIAYAVNGSGPVLVRVLGWFTHVEMEWQWPALRLIWERLGETHTVTRYDGRGIGLSGSSRGQFSEETRERDLEAVLDAVGVEPVVLYGVSEGGWTAACYACAHPERVSHLILYGAYARGTSLREGFDPEEAQALLTLMRKGWGRDTPEIRQIFTTAYFGPDADPALVGYFNRLQRASADADTATRYQESLNRRGDISRRLADLRTPTLVIHCEDDRIIPFAEGRHLASIIQGARFLALPTGTHYFPVDDAVTSELVEAIDRFTHSTGS